MFTFKGYIFQKKQNCLHKAKQKAFFSNNVNIEAQWIYHNKRPLPMEEGFQMFPRAKMASEKSRNYSFIDTNIPYLKYYTKFYSSCMPS